MGFSQNAKSPDGVLSRLQRTENVTRKRFRGDGPTRLSEARRMGIQRGIRMGIRMAIPYPPDVSPIAHPNSRANTRR